MNFLIANDDGIQSPSLKALARILADYGRVFCCAPAREQSGVSQAFTFLKPLQVQRVEGWPGEAYQIDGTPADCVKLALNELIDEPIDLTFAGVNLGLNLGVAVIYSGTVAAARESALWDVPSVALSIEEWGAQSESAVRRWLDEFFAQKVYLKLIPGIYWNVNFPSAEDYSLEKTRFCTMGSVMYTDTYSKKNGAYTLTGGKDAERFEDPTDDFWHHRGYTTIVPLQIDQTHYGLETKPGSVLTVE